MGNIPAPTDWTLKTYLDGRLLDTDTRNIRQEVDADNAYGGNHGLSKGSNLAASMGFRRGQTAEPSAPSIIYVPVPEFSTVGYNFAQPPLFTRYLAWIPFDARLAKVFFRWRTIAVSNNNSFITLKIYVGGFLFTPGQYAPGVGQQFQQQGRIFLTSHDQKWQEVQGRPIVYGGSIIPIDVNVDFDGDGLTLQGLTVAIALNAGHIK